MTTSSAAHLRSQFLDYFSQRGHQIVASAGVVPQNDPTLMFTNAGMVQFKDLFVGAETRDYTRATTTQKCMRVSGKHNDLEEVGRSRRHHTFFEMLGNFSFGDYFKAEAIEFAWQFISQDLAMPKDKIWVTVFGGEGDLGPDDEARQLWKKIAGIPDDRIVNMGMKDNFWAMGDTGPCGPCTEIHFDQGKSGSPAVTLADFESGRVIEFWNNVFMQYERHSDGRLEALPKPSVDTGMGLERLVALAQGQDSNYHTDLFMPLLETTAELAKKKYQRSDSEDDVSMRVIADHARATTFLVADGIQPSNEGRGYVMRRIMRRAIRHGRRLGFDEPFFYQVCDRVVDLMGDAFGEVSEARALVAKVAELEEKGFRRTLDGGLSILESEISALRDKKVSTLEGKTVFKLYDTFGFPPDLTATIAEEQGFSIDQTGFDAAMAEQKERSRGATVGDKAVGDVYKAVKERVGVTEFVGYEHESVSAEARTQDWRSRTIDGHDYLQTKTKVVALIDDGASVESAKSGRVEVVLQPCPFYGESGGQVGDRGIIELDGAVVKVTDCQKPLDDFIVCRGQVLGGELKVGDNVWAGYDSSLRREIRAHHSATHLLHGSLRKVLGDHVKQAGSRVDADRLRFDYSHFESPTVAEMRAVEADANRRVNEGNDVATELLSFEAAKAKGALAFFGDKYGDEVRVISMGESVELCGGTHVANTGDIQLVLITSEEAVSSGVRRMEAQVGEAAKKRAAEFSEQLAAAGQALGGEGSSDNPIVQAVNKAHQHQVNVSEQLVSHGQAALPELKGVSVASIASADITTAVATRLRDEWNALVRLTNTKATEAGDVLSKLSNEFSGIADDGILAAYVQLMEANREAERTLDREKQKALSAGVGPLLDGAKVLGEHKIIAHLAQNTDGKALRQLSDQIKDQIGSGIWALCAQNGEKAALLVGVSGDLVKKVRAGDLVKEIAPIVDGRGGGKPELAQAGGASPDKAPEALARFEALVSEKLGF